MNGSQESDVICNCKFYILWISYYVIMLSYDVNYICYVMLCCKFSYAMSCYVENHVKLCYTIILCHVINHAILCCKIMMLLEHA